MKIVCEEKNCIGCRSCENICPKSAIYMKTNEKGFLKSIIKQDVCVDCGLCIKVCNYSDVNLKDTNEEKNHSIIIYGVKNRDEEVRKNSSSGGVFYLIAKHVIGNNGVVYGCILDEKIHAVFNRAETLEDIIPMMGSKYVYSDVEKTFYSIVNDLQMDRMVLFTGSPCQCWQLKRYLNVKKIDISRLVLLEFLCHGSPSPIVFEGYKKSVEDKYKGKIISFKFRDKEKVKNPPSCRGMRSQIKLNSGHTIDIYDEQLNDRYFELFKRNYISNDSCYECKFVGFNNRSADITLADFWGCEVSYPSFFDKRGVSLVLINSDIGMKIFELIKSEIEYINVERDKCLQVPLKKQPSKPEDYDLFWKVFLQDGYMKANKKIVNKYLLQKKYYDFRKNVKGLLIKFGMI